MKYIAKTFYGLEQVLSDELDDLGAGEVKIGNRLVSFSGDKAMLYKANMYLRCALRILMPLFTFNARTEEEYYKEIYRFNWEPYLTCKKSFAIDSVVNSKYFKHSMYMALKCKDAIVDKFRDKNGIRPVVDTKNPDIRIHVHISEDKCTVSLDSSGESLHKRGYRVQKGEAPINEVLAAGLIKLTGWDGKSNFVDSMCGSGTILMEAAMIAANVYPFVMRESYGFMNWPDFETSIYEKLKSGGPVKMIKVNIFGSDNSENAISVAKINMRKLKYIEGITLHNEDINDYIPPTGEGIALINPPYGERMSNDKLLGLYEKLGNSLKRNYSGYVVWIISSNMDAFKKVGLHASKSITIYNGPLKCRFQKYEIYTGSKKKKYLNA